MFKNLNQWDWIIGTGCYVDDIEDVALMEEKLSEEINSVIISIFYLHLFL